MRTLLAAVIALLLALPAQASDFSRAAVGTTGSEFLLFDTSARGIAMGGAYSAATDDASSIYWNPAGLSRVPSVSATLMHARYVADITYNAAAVATRLNDSSVIAAGLRYLDIGTIPQTDINGLQRGDFHPSSYVAEVGWGQAISDMSDNEMDIALGVSVKYLNTDLGSRASAYGGDIGVLSRFYGAARTYDISLAVQNIGAGQKFDSTRDTLPLRLRFGGDVRPIKPLLLTVEAIAPVNNVPHGAAGMEYTLDIDKNIKCAGRLGVNTLTYESLGATSMLNLGFGVAFSDLSFDYAFAPTGTLGAQVHRVSLSYNIPAKTSQRYREN